MANGTIILRQWHETVEGRKWMTRRGLPEPPADDNEPDTIKVVTSHDDERIMEIQVRDKSGNWRVKWQVGQHLCIMTGRGKPALWRSLLPHNYFAFSVGEPDNAVLYERCHVTVTALRVERLQDMPPEDALREGVTDLEAYKVLYASINGPKAWAKNGRVAVISYKYET